MLTLCQLEDSRRVTVQPERDVDTLSTGRQSEGDSSARERDVDTLSTGRQSEGDSSALERC